MNATEQRKNARDFVGRWQAKEGNEQRESNSYWIELCQNVLGIANPTTVLDFERKVKGRRIDVFFEDVGVLIENKSRGINLDTPEQRGKDRYGNIRWVTPFEQAKWYADNITPRSIMPKWIITCNFDEIRIHDLDREDAETNYETILLKDLPNEFHRLSFFTSKAHSRIEREKRLSIQAGEVVGRLYDTFSKAYLNIESSEREQRSLNILITRIVFLLYAEDADLLHEHDAFYNYLKNFQVAHMRQALIDLFSVLKTPDEQRDPYLDPALLAFPFVNGGLFEEEIVIPRFDQITREMLLNEASMEFDWSDISPTIFGAVFESTLNPETRRAGGMHYTSVENIHKVTGPLFYDALKDELTAIEGLKSRKERDFKLNAFRKKIASIRVLDPACGSGNFLTETYLSLRKLENRVLENLYGDQMAFGLMDPIQVSIDQFFGIEINDFAVEVAKTALWIAELQMLDETREILNTWIDALPLKSNDNIVCGNALRMDWNDVLPAEQCGYIVGNPPFVGHQWRTKDQQDDMADMFKGLRGYGKLDYVCAWYEKAVEYIESVTCRCAFVSTNSICQGESVGILWRHLAGRGVSIDFAYSTFVWNSEASDQAHVHVVIVGFGIGDAEHAKTLYIEGNPALEVEHINGYLSPAPDAFIANRGRPLNKGVPAMTKGSQPTDGGGLLLNGSQRRELLAKYPSYRNIIRPYVGGREFLNGGDRWCLWLDGVELDECMTRELSDRLDIVRKARLGSPTKSVVEAAETPHLFTQIRQPSNSYIAVPEVSSGRRVYIPIGYLESDVIASNKLRFIPTDSLYVFGLLSSKMHAAWMRVVGGRLKSDYSYSPAVYNSFIFPRDDERQRQVIEHHAQQVLDARAMYPGSSLATLYDPDKMPADLLAAHLALDVAVEEAYGVNFGGDETRIVAHLFELYAQKA